MRRSLRPRRRGSRVARLAEGVDAPLGAQRERVLARRGDGALRRLVDWQDGGARARVRAAGRRSADEVSAGEYLSEDPGNALCLIKTPG